MDLFFISATLLTGALIYTFMHYIPSEQKKAITTAFGQVAAAYNFMTECRTNTCLDQVIVWRTHNGNGMPIKGSPLKLSLVLESFADNFESLYDKSQGLRIDEPSIVIFQQAIHTGSFTSHVEEMPASMLRSIFSNQGAGWLRIVYLGDDTQKCYFVSYTTKGTHRDTPYTLNQEAELLYLENRLKRMYQRNKPLRKRIKGSLLSNF